MFQVGKLSLCCILIFNSSSFFADSIKECNKKCNAAFGKKIGENNLTQAFSNCNDNCVAEKSNYISLLSNKKIYTGMKWQCVEYARRWLIENKGYTFDGVQYAYQIWKLKDVKNVYTEQRKPLLKYKNQKTKVPPEVGDMLIQDNSKNVAGHISIVTSVNKDHITIAEQNYTNGNWQHKDSARKVLLKKNKDGNYLVQDKSIIGWLRV